MAVTTSSMLSSVFNNYSSSSRDGATSDVLLTDDCLNRDSLSSTASCCCDEQSSPCCPCDVVESTTVEPDYSRVEEKTMAETDSGNGGSSCAENIGDELLDLEQVVEEDKTDDCSRSNDDLPAEAPDNDGEPAENKTEETGCTADTKKTEGTAEGVESAGQASDEVVPSSTPQEQEEEEQVEKKTERTDHQPVSSSGSDHECSSRTGGEDNTKQQQYVVNVHVNPGETFSVCINDQLQLIQGSTYQ